MRKIVASEFVTLDGVIDAAHGLTSRYSNDELGQVLGSHMAETDALLLGRVTYEEMASHWAQRASDDDPVAIHMTKPKYVVSTTLTNTEEWKPSTLIDSNVAETLQSLKHQPGKNILVVGSATLVRFLAQAQVLDELQLIVFPIVVGHGKRLFADGDGIAFELAESTILETGVVVLTYTPSA